MNISVRHPIVPAQSVDRLPSLDLVDWRTDTLVDLLRRRAAENPKRILYTFLEDGESRERSLTAGELEAAARRIGASLAKFAKSGDRVVLLFDDGLDYIAGLFGCLGAGLVAVSGVHPGAPRAAERLLGIIRDARATVVLGHARVLAEFQRILDDEDDAADLRWMPTDLARPGKADADASSWAWVPAANKGLALLQYTSGSSRAPRGVMLSHRNVLHNLRGQAMAFGYKAGDTGVSWLPFSHDMGLIGCVLMAVYGGGRCVVLSPAHFLEDPLRWLRAVSRYRAAMSGGPSFAYDLCAQRAETADLGALDLSSWTVAVNGAEPIRADIVRRFVRTFASAGFDARAIHPSYGLAEATLFVTGGKGATSSPTRLFDRASLRDDIARPSPLTQASPEAVELVGCGRGLSDQHVAIVDTKTLLPLAPGQIGEIWVAGPSISEGYFGRMDENTAYFGGDLGDGNVYLKTGDLGFVLDDELYVTGRSRDLIIIRGKNYYPQDLEHSAETSHSAIRPGSSACFTTEGAGALVIVSELLRAQHDDAANAAAAIRAAIVRDHGINPHRVVLAAWGSVLKTPSGKVQRAQTRAALAEGQVSIVHEAMVVERAPEPKTLPALGPVDFDHVIAWFLAKLRDTGVDVTSFDATTRLTDLGFDSLKIVELKVELERDLGIAVAIADLYAFPDLQSLADHVRHESVRKHDASAVPRQNAATSRAAPNRLAEQRRRRSATNGSAGDPPSL